MDIHCFESSSRTNNGVIDMINEVKLLQFMCFTWNRSDRAPSVLGQKVANTITIEKLLNTAYSVQTTFEPEISYFQSNLL